MKQFSLISLSVISLFRASYHLNPAVCLCSFSCVLSKNLNLLAKQNFQFSKHTGLVMLVSSVRKQKCFFFLFQLQNCRTKPSPKKRKTNEMVRISAFPLNTVKKNSKICFDQRHGVLSLLLLCQNRKRY